MISVQWGGIITALFLLFTFLSGVPMAFEIDYSRGCVVTPRSFDKLRLDYQIVLKHLISKATYKPRIHQKSGKKLEAGQVLTTITDLVQVFELIGFTRKKIRLVLSGLEELKLIEINSLNNVKQGKVITIINYERFTRVNSYNLPRATKGPREGPREKDTNPLDFQLLTETENEPRAKRKTMKGPRESCKPNKHNSLRPPKKNNSTYTLPSIFIKATDIFDLWNLICAKQGNLPKVLSRSPERIKCIEALLEHFPDKADWILVFSEFANNPYWSRSKWKGGSFTIDYLLKPGKFVALFERIKNEKAGYQRQQTTTGEGSQLLKNGRLADTGKIKKAIKL